MSLPSSPRRAIRSFVRREGRMTDAQRRAFDAHWARFGIDAGEAPLDFAALFGRVAPVTLEIGFGNGDALATLAALHPENDYLGIEVHRPGVGSLLRRIEAEALNNVRVACVDAVGLLARVPDGSLDAIYLFFPDPWPKKRHHKRRLVQPGFVALARRKLRIQGRLCMATDWEDYARHMYAVLAADPGLENLAIDGVFVSRPEARPLTRFERRGQKLGHGVWDLAFRRTA